MAKKCFVFTESDNGNHVEIEEGCANGVGEVCIVVVNDAGRVTEHIDMWLTDLEYAVKKLKEQEKDNG